MKYVGLMSGTSLDGVDCAIIETDGDRVSRFGPALSYHYTEDERAALKGAIASARKWQFCGSYPREFLAAETVIKRTHANLVFDLCRRRALNTASLDAVGFHGQTLLHDPPRDGNNGRTYQIGNGQALANALQCPVIYDFRQEDMKNGGHGAPLVPIYHSLLVKWSGLETPLGVLNLGGIANLTMLLEIWKINLSLLPTFASDT